MIRKFHRKTKALLFFLATSLILAAPIHAEEMSREPYVAGSFYPAATDTLNRMVDEFMILVPSQKKADGRVSMLIVPHAGYVYSGQTAAYAYDLVKNGDWDTVVLIGPYHRTLFQGASIWRKGVWKTPLGEVRVDSALADAIAGESESFRYTQDAHLWEHSLEVQLPFLQKILKNFKIVPILVSNPSLENTQPLASAIVKHISERKKTLVVVSTDMSHYFPDATARKMDEFTLELLRKKDPLGLRQALLGGKSELCGAAAVVTGLEIARLLGDTRLEVLRYSNSGDVTDDKSRVVGYTSCAIYRAERNDGLNLAQRKELLKIARNSTESYVSKGERLQPQVDDEVLKQDGAVFVTIRKDAQLRGCIGRILPEEPLYLAVQNMAIESATKDPRFKPIRADELKELDYEISVLSAPVRVATADEIVIGKHGVILRQGHRSGVFLPKVAEETGWTREEFLNELCSQKAGLQEDCWQDPATELYVFTAEEFGE